MEIHTEVQRGLLCLTVSGEVDVNSCLRIMVKALDEAAEKRIYKILVNARPAAALFATERAAAC
jgi:3,4-dihydroxy-2-butanone 4-phosphate synthase